MPKIPGFLDFVIQIPFLGSGPNSQIDFFEMDLFQPLIFFFELQNDWTRMGNFAKNIHLYWTVWRRSTLISSVSYSTRHLIYWLKNYFGLKLKVI